MTTLIAEEVRAYLRTFVQPGQGHAGAEGAVRWEERRWPDGCEGPACQFCDRPLCLGDIHLARQADVDAAGATRFPICGECRWAYGGDPDFVIATPVLPGQLSLLEA